MTAAVRPPRFRLGGLAMPSGGARGRLWLYALLLGAALVFLLATASPGLVLWLVGAAALAGLALALLSGNAAFVRLAALLAAALAAAVPLGPVFAGESLVDVAERGFIWPEVLVLAFAGRVLAEESDLRFAAFWRDPLAARRRAEAQSTAAAVCLGLALTLAFYHWAAPFRPAASTDALGLLASALLGETFIHAAIIVLFFTVAAYVLDAVLIHLRDRAAFSALRTVFAEAPADGAAAARLRQLVTVDFAPLAHTRAMRLVLETLDRHSAGHPAAAGASIAGFFAASRRFIRALLSFLPLLGFLGTVVGLATAIGTLPTGGGEGAFDVAGSLAGLAIKFETTLLGLTGSIIAAMALASLEKGEAELAAEASRFVEAATTADVR
jgi:hypothetical protein